MITRDDAALAAYLKASAENPYGFIAEQRQARAAREELRSLRFGKEEFEGPSLRTRRGPACYSLPNNSPPSSACRSAPSPHSDNKAACLSLTWGIGQSFSASLTCCARLIGAPRR